MSDVLPYLIDFPSPFNYSASVLVDCITEAHVYLLFFGIALWFDGYHILASVHIDKLPSMLLIRHNVTVKRLLLFDHWFYYPFVLL